MAALLTRSQVLGPTCRGWPQFARSLRVYQDETPLTWAHSGNGRATGGPEIWNFCCFAAWIEWFDVVSLALQLPPFYFIFHCGGHYAGCGNIHVFCCLPFGGFPVATNYLTTTSIGVGVLLELNPTRHEHGSFQSPC